MRLTVGPHLFNWPVDRWMDFYARLADEAPVDKVVVGEVVCSKRAPFYEDRIAAVAERLQRGGKQVVLASLGLLTTTRERRAAAETLGEGFLPVEINDLTALAWRKAGFEVGPLVNVYNEGSLEHLARKGATSICLPPELPMSSVEILAGAGRAAGVEVEVWSWGRTPLAMSGRCYHARAHGLTKDSCQFVCANDDDGLEVGTLEGQPFLAVNGVQTMSFNFTNLAGDVEALARAGVASLRLSPHSGDFVSVCRVFRDRIDGIIDAQESMARCASIHPQVIFSHGFLMGTHGAQSL